MITTNCLLCESNSRVQIWSHRKDRFLQRLSIKKRVHFHICRSCGLAYASPRLDKSELESLYSQDYRAERITEEHLEEKIKQSRERIEFLRLSYAFNAGKVLEIGSSEGTLLKLLRDEEGWDVKGCEPYAAYAKHGINRWGIDTRVSFFNPSDFKREFDLLVLIHVIEHIPNPVQFIRELGCVILDGGYLLLETPDLHRPYRTRIKHAMFPAPHLAIYSPVSISRLLEDAGFSIVEIQEDLNMRVLAKYTGVKESHPSPKPAYLLRIVANYRLERIIELKVVLTRLVAGMGVRWAERILSPTLYKKVRNVLR